MPKSKKNIKVRDLKPNKDAKGGGPHGVAGHTTAGNAGISGHTTAGNTGISGRTGVSGRTGMDGHTGN